MQTIYNFAIGYLAWAAWAIFIGGVIWRISTMISKAKKKEMVVYAYMDLGYSMRSIVRWSTPFATLGWQKNPDMTVATFIFHISLVLLALFAPGHAVMWDYLFGIGVPSLPEALADGLTIAVILCCFFFIFRRLRNPAVRYVTSSHDWAVLALVTLVFVSGLFAKLQIGPTLPVALIHVLSGEAILIAIPFTRLSHAFFIPFTRAYMGSEFGGVRHCPDW